MLAIAAEDDILVPWTVTEDFDAHGHGSRAC